MAGASSHKEFIKKVSIAHLFLSLWFATYTNAYTSLDQEPQILSAYQDILKLKLESGRSKLSRIIPTQSQLGHYHFVLSLADVLEIVLTEDEGLYKSYIDNLDRHLRGLREMESNDPHRLFYSSEIRIHWAVAQMMFEDEFKAAFSLKTAYSDIENNIERFPDFKPNLKSYGIMHVLFATVPDTYHWVLKFFGIEANAIKGWEELDQIDKRSPYWVETSIIKSLISLNVINIKDQTMQLLDELLAVQKDNLLVNYIYHSALIKYAQSEDALVGLKKLIYTGKTYLYLPSIHYLLGEIYIQKQNYALARYYYAKFLNEHHGRNYVKDAWFKVFLTYWLDNNKKMAELHWIKAQKSGQSVVAADRNAHDLLESSSYPNAALMKARLATDGGYFLLATHALNDINQGSLGNKKEECEYFYRYARLFDKENKHDDAIFYYLNAIKKAGKESWYFAPSAALHTGYIYDELGDYEKARYYYQKATSYKKHKYKIGIDNKSYAALQILKLKYPED